jgi:hypothetical protein
MYPLDCYFGSVIACSGFGLLGKKEVSSKKLAAFLPYHIPIAIKEKETRFSYIWYEFHKNQMLIYIYSYQSANPKNINLASRHISEVEATLVQLGVKTLKPYETIVKVTLSGL